MSKTNAVATKNENAVATASAFDDFAGEGFGHTSANDFVIPRVGIVGSLSPQLKKNKAEYIESAEEGDLVDVAMSKILAKGFSGESFPFLPVIRVKDAITWRPRTSGGGIVKREVLAEEFEAYAAREGAVQNDKYEFKLPNGNEIILTHQFYGINLIDGTPCFIPMKKSNLKIARKWMTKMRSIKLPNGKGAPMFYKTWNIGSFLDSGNQNEWPNFTVTDGPLLQEIEGWQDIFTAATELLKIIDSGDFRADVDNDVVEDVDGEQIPF